MMSPFQAEERIQRPVAPEPWTKPGGDDGPKTPDVRRPDRVRTSV